MPTKVCPSWKAYTSFIGKLKVQNNSKLTEPIQSNVLHSIVELPMISKLLICAQQFN